ncbi:MAG TPA: serine hydrolase domain-containing protein [Gemmatimonadaceae bacterium]|nr:serine hydrolase domain-containing protein [Gemmatimonadaceae bacterium]
MMGSDLGAIVDRAATTIRHARPGVGGIVAAISGADVCLRPFGTLGTFDRRAVCETTVFEIGSVTKLFTAALLAATVLDGRAALNEPVAELLPELRGLADDITLVRLATHTAGLPRLPRNLIGRSWIRHPLNPYAGYTERALVDALRRHRPARRLPPIHRTPVRYSNLGAGLLGAALARRLNLSYEAAVVAYVCAPLGMNDTRIALTRDQGERFAAPHGVFGLPAARWEFGALQGAGALRSTPADLIRFARASAGAAPEPLRSALLDAQHLRVETRDADGRLSAGLGLAWHAFETVGARRLVLWHNGSTGGYRSFLALVPALRLGVVALANRAPGLEDRLRPATALDRIALTALRDLLRLDASDSRPA